MASVPLLLTAAYHLSRAERRKLREQYAKELASQPPLKNLDHPHHQHQDQQQPNQVYNRNDGDQDGAFESNDMHPNQAHDDGDDNGANSNETDAWSDADEECSYYVEHERNDSGGEEDEEDNNDGENTHQQQRGEISSRTEVKPKRALSLYERQVIWKQRYEPTHKNNFHILELHLENVLSQAMVIFIGI